MFKAVVVLIVAAFVIAFFNDPKSLTPWREAAVQTGGAVSKAVTKAGEATNQELKDIQSGNSVVNKVPDVVSSAVTSVGTAVKDATK